MHHFIIKYKNIYIKYKDEKKKGKRSIISAASNEISVHIQYISLIDIIIISSFAINEKCFLSF